MPEIPVNLTDSSLPGTDADHSESQYFLPLGTQKPEAAYTAKDLMH
jgi:hypothetical protein